MPETLAAGNAVTTGSVPAARLVDNIVLGADTAESYTVPSGCNYIVASGTDGFWYKVGVASLGSTGVGTAFTNQPANDGVEIVSDDAGDTTQTITIIGTTVSTDTVVVEEVALDGTNAVSTTKTDWGVILAVKLDASAGGTVTVREASGNATITTLTTGTLSKGVVEITDSSGVGGLVQFVASGATTKQIGIQGTNASGTTIYDSQALSGTTAVYSNSVFASVTEVYVGDLENSVSVTVTVGAATVPAADNTDGYGSFYVPSGIEVRVEQGVAISFCRVASTANTISIARYS